MTSVSIRQSLNQLKLTGQAPTTARMSPETLCEWQNSVPLTQVILSAEELAACPDSMAGVLIVIDRTVRSGMVEFLDASDSVIAVCN